MEVRLHNKRLHWKTFLMRYLWTKLKFNSDVKCENSGPFVKPLICDIIQAFALKDKFSFSKSSQQTPIKMYLFIICCNNSSLFTNVNKKYNFLCISEYMWTKSKSKAMFCIFNSCFVLLSWVFSCWQREDTYRCSLEFDFLELKMLSSHISLT